MKRIIWIAVTILIMVCILGFGLHTLNNIDEVNRRRREMQEGEKMASQIASTAATTSIWDKLRSTTTETPAGTIIEENTEIDFSQTTDEMLSTDDMPEDGGFFTMPAPENDNSFSETDTTPAAQTTTTAIVIHVN